MRERLSTNVHDTTKHYWVTTIITINSTVATIITVITVRIRFINTIIIIIIINTVIFGFQQWRKGYTLVKHQRIKNVERLVRLSSYKFLLTTEWQLMLVWIAADAGLILSWLCWLMTHGCVMFSVWIRWSSIQLNKLGILSNIFLTKLV